MTLENTVKKYRELFKSKPAVKTAHEESKGHFYVSPTTQEKYHSVTFFTSTLRDPSLANWKMGRAIDFIKENLPLADSNYKLPGGSDLFEQSKLAPEGIFQNAGFVGTSTHRFMEEWFKSWIDQGKISLSDAEIDAWPLPENIEPEVISGCRAIKKFLKTSGAIPVAVELPLVDDELKVGGQIDSLVVMPNPIKVEVEDPVLGKGFKIQFKPYLTFLDLKTSNMGSKPSYGFQVRGFYQRMIWKTFKVRPKKTYILHTSKENGDFKLIDLTDMSFLEKDVKHLVEISRSYDEVVKAFKPKQIII